MELKHPTLPATVQVDEVDVKKWVKQGWVAPKPPAPKPRPVEVKPEPVKEPESK